MKPEYKKYFLIIALGFIAYANLLNGKFLYDDLVFIKDNAFIKSPSLIINCFTKEIPAGTGMGRRSSFYRPLQTASYAINYAICKLDVRGYHLTNTILHIAVALCVFWFINILFQNNFLSLVTAILFVVHPIQTEAVSYISGRCDPLAFFFIILCMSIYIKLLNQDRFNIVWFIFLLLSYMCALLSKEHSLILPFLLLLYHLVFKKRIKVITFLSLLGVAAIYMVIRASVLKPIPASLVTDTILDRIPGLFVAIFSYIKLLFLPFSLHMEYGQRIFTWTDPRAIGGILISLAILILGYFKRSNKIILFSIGWFFLALLPVSNLYRINFFMAEHFLYIPSMGAFLLIAYFLSILYNDKKYKIAALILVTVGTVFFLGLTIKQNDYWKDPLTLYKRTLEFSSDSANANINLGQIYIGQGKFTEALFNFNKALEIDPNSADAYDNRGYVYDKLGDYHQALLDYNKAIELNPKYPETYNNRGSTNGKNGNYDQAILDYNKAIELNPDFAEAYSNRGNVYNIQNNYDQAILDYNKAIEIDPKYEKAYFNRGLAYDNKNNLDEAILDYSKTLELNPAYVEVYNNRGSAFYNKGNYDQAILDYNTAIKLSPNYPEAYNNRGSAYNRKGNYDQAISDYNKAIELNSNYPEAYNNLGRAYNSKGKYDQAILNYNKAIELNPNYAKAYSNRAMAYDNQKEFDKALRDLHKAQELGAKINLE